jgi:hypothetical protein
MSIDAESNIDRADKSRELCEKQRRCTYRKLSDNKSIE